jgi:hypothetical protein
VIEVKSRVLCVKGGEGGRASCLAMCMICMVAFRQAGKNRVLFGIVGGTQEGAVAAERFECSGSSAGSVIALARNPRRVIKTLQARSAVGFCSLSKGIERGVRCRFQ